MAQFKQVTGSSGKVHYRLSMGPKEAASLVAALDRSLFGGHYLNRVVRAINENSYSFELPSVEAIAEIKVE